MLHSWENAALVIRSSPVRFLPERMWVHCQAVKTSSVWGNFSPIYLPRMKLLLLPILVKSLDQTTASQVDLTSTDTLFQMRKYYFWLSKWLFESCFISYQFVGRHLFPFHPSVFSQNTNFRPSLDAKIKKKQQKYSILWITMAELDDVYTTHAANTSAHKVIDWQGCDQTICLMLLKGGDSQSLFIHNSKLKHSN